jgi:hypothetical protein
MFKKLIFLLSILLFSCASEKKQETTIFILTNPTSFERLAAPIVISQQKVNEILKVENTPNSIYFETETQEIIPFQKDTLNGKVEYSLSLNFKANESKKIVILHSNENQKTEFQQFTNVRLGKDSNADGVFDDITFEVREPNHLPGSVPVLYQAEGISWENDKVGFRLYWDKRNGKDIWGKTTSKMVMDSVGLPNTPSYHELHPWGVDVLKVGNSLGAGAIAMKKDTTIYRLGETKTATFKVLAEGPIRTIFTLAYTGWNVKGELYDFTEKITIWKGKYWYKSELFLKGNKEILVAGIVNINLKNETLNTLKPNPKKTIIYTYDNQTELQDNLGLALILNTNELVNVGKAPSTGTGRSIDGNSPISHTFYAELKENEQPVSFYFVAAWEQTDIQFKTKKGFEKMLVKEANSIANPIEIK